MRVHYYNKQTKRYAQLQHAKRVLVKWCKYALIGAGLYAAYAAMYLMLVAAGCPY